MVEVRIVPKTVFNSHVHNYRKLIRIGADSDDKFASPSWSNVVDDSETKVSEPVDLESVGVEVSTSPTTGPV